MFEKTNMAKNNIISYNPKLKQYARQLRKSTTKSKRVLWQEIRDKKLGVEFHRQVPIDEFIVDFFCHELKLTRCANYFCVVRCIATCCFYITIAALSFRKNLFGIVRKLC